MSSRGKAGAGRVLAGLALSLTAACDSTAPEVTPEAPSALNALSVRTTLLPPGVQGLPYGLALSASGGSGAPITWTVESGALPPGVTLAPGGAFSGFPTSTGSFTFTVGVQGYEAAQATFTIHIAPIDDSRFNITRYDVAPVPAAAEEHFLTAISRWESIIVGNLSEDSIPRGFFGSGHCAGFFAARQGHLCKPRGSAMIIGAEFFSNFFQHRSPKAWKIGIALPCGARTMRA